MCKWTTALLVPHLVLGRNLARLHVGFLLGWYHLSARAHEAATLLTRAVALQLLIVSASRTGQRNYWASCNLDLLELASGERIWE